MEVSWVDGAVRMVAPAQQAAQQDSATAPGSPGVGIARTNCRTNCRTSRDTSRRTISRGIGPESGMRQDTYLDPTAAPTRADIDASCGPSLLEFGTDWCGHCRAAGPAVQAALANHPGLRHVRVEDGPGRALGRSFGVTLWPTLVFVKDGQEQARLVRPRDTAPIAQALQAIATGPVGPLHAPPAGPPAHEPDAIAVNEADPDAGARRDISRPSTTTCWPVLPAGYTTGA
jgi:thioredoxin 1